MSGKADYPFGSDPPANGRELRQHPRLPLSTNHYIAPYRGLSIPSSDLFQPVTCYDISRGGFSYLADRFPQINTILLRMMVHENLIYVAARIVNHRKTRDGMRYIIGCKFTGRVCPNTGRPI